MEILLIGIVTALNLIFIKFKFDRSRWEDGFLDLMLLMILSFIFGGSYAGLVVATITSLIISIYLFFSPPRFTRRLRTFFSNL